jgi:tetratricopeptide (TPR) repeat protein
MSFDSSDDHSASPLPAANPWPIDIEDQEPGQFSDPNPNYGYQPLYSPQTPAYNQPMFNQAAFNDQSQPMQPMYQDQQREEIELAKSPGRWARPFPRWALLTSAIGILVLLIVLHLTGSDWAMGALHAAYAALVIGIFLLLLFVVRLVDGLASPLNTTRGWQIATSILALLLLFLYSGALQFTQPNIHTLQARYLESHQQWQTAINEYQFSGEKAPNGADIARTYASWGLALNGSHQYNEALTKFAVVIDQFNAVQSQLQRAHEGKIAALLALGEQELQNKDYTDATDHFATILGLSYCNQTCTAKVDPLAASAYYNQGETALGQKKYTDSVDAFNTVLTQFSSAPEAKRLHKDMAKALLGQGQSELSTACSSAIPTYQQLANAYSDTAQGRTAKAALNEPQNVEGTFANNDPSATFDQIGLTQGLNGSMTQDQVFNAWYNARQTTIQSDGSFVFHNVPQGDYDLIWYTSDGTMEIAGFLYQQGTNKPIYTAHVGPLCPANVGTISNSTSTNSTPSNT